MKCWRNKNDICTKKNVYVYPLWVAQKPVKVYEYASLVLASEVQEWEHAYWSETEEWKH